MDSAALDDLLGEVRFESLEHWMKLDEQRGAYLAIFHQHLSREQKVSFEGILELFNWVIEHLNVVHRWIKWLLLRLFHLPLQYFARMLGPRVRSKEHVLVRAVRLDRRPQRHRISLLLRRLWHPVRDDFLLPLLDNPLDSLIARVLLLFHLEDRRQSRLRCPTKLNMLRFDSWQLCLCAADRLIRHYAHLGADLKVERGSPAAAHRGAALV